MSNEERLSHNPENGWTKIAATADLDGREALHVVVDGLAIAIFKIAGGFYATDAFCTHAAGLLCEGYIEAEEVECPLHAARFHIPTGKALSAPAVVDLKTYPLKVLDGDILVTLQETEGACNTKSAAT